MTGRIDRPVADLEKDIESLQTDQYLTLTLVDVKVVDIFLDQYIREAERLSRLLAENFDIEAIYLFGSLVWNTVHVPETDIDLAVRGLPGDQLFKAIGVLERESKFSVDLVELEKLSDHFREKILIKGRKLIEPEPVIVVSG